MQWAGEPVFFFVIIKILGRFYEKFQSSNFEGSITWNEKKNLKEQEVTCKISQYKLKDWYASQLVKYLLCKKINVHLKHTEEFSIKVILTFW